VQIVEFGQFLLVLVGESLDLPADGAGWRFG
jgi:hypothetical protein